MLTAAMLTPRSHDLDAVRVAIDAGSRIAMGRFASTVAYYENARPSYGAALFAGVALELGLDRSQRLLDVGAGPGILTIGFARFCREAVGVDPEPGMVEAARAASERAGVAVRFIEGRFEDVAASLGAFDIVSIGRAIHWLDPELARAALDRVLAPRGRVLVCGATTAKDGRNPWLETFNAVRDRWKGDRPSRDHHTFFADGSFTRTGTIRVEGTYAVPVERLIERVLSMSTSSSERLGDEVPAMKSAMREALAPFASGGMIEDIVEARAEVFERA
jgi:SAM-dependent methyltransferase